MENDRRIREVWETTQENLETAVGSAYSGWNSFYLRHFEPCLKSTTSCFTSCCYDNRSHRANIRHDSLDIFFDMYDDDEAVGRDELERLLSSGDNDVDSENDQVYGSGSGGIDVVQPTYEQARKPSVPDVITRMFSGRPRSSSGPQQPNGVRRYLTSLFPSLARYRPSTNDLQTRARSNTKSSTQSSETYRSRRDLFSDDDNPDEDAQMMSDNFAQDLEFRTSGTPSVNDQTMDDGLSIAGEHLGLSDKQLREEELQLEMEEESEAARLAALRNEASTSRDYPDSHTKSELGYDEEDDEYDEEES